MLYQDGIINLNPADNALKDIKKNNGMTDGIRRALTPEQETVFLNYVRTERECEKWKDLMIIMFGTGMRVSEVLGLVWENIDFVNRTITVDHAVVRNTREPGCPYHISTPKTEAGKRVIPMLDEVYDSFDRIYKKQEKEGWPTVVIDGLEDFIFVNNEGRLLNFQNVNAAIEVMRRNCNEKTLKGKTGLPIAIVPHFSCHVIRHTFCARLCEVESNIKVIQEIMGHKDIRTTMEKYAEISIGRKKEAIARHSMNLIPA
jgi:integrase